MKKGFIILGWVLSLCLIFLPGELAFSQTGFSEIAQFIEKKVSGEVNWTLGYIRATGSGFQAEWAKQEAQKVESARVAAVGVAERNLLETVKGIVIDSQTTIRNQMVENDIINKRVTGVLKGARILEDLTKVDEYPDGSVKVTITVEAPINGKGQLADIILPDRIESKNPFDVTKAEAKVKGITIDQVYTGLVIDAKGLGVTPAMAPKIITDDGMEIYGYASVNRDYAIKQGIVGYAKDIDSAKNLERVADNPLIVKAVKVTGPNKTDIVVTLDDGYRIHKAKQKLGFLQQCRVIIVVD